MASDGGPIATCRPGTNCDPSTKLRETAQRRRPDSDLPSGHELRSQHQAG
jgi:hypothetical protein